MKIWYLDHSGFAVETEQHFLVFDYYNDEPSGGSLSDGVINLAQLPEEKRLVVFVSHSHSDHYNRVIHSWQEKLPDTMIFLSKDIRHHDNCITIHHGESTLQDGIAVTTLRSTDQGVAYLVTVDGKTIYHAGDLNWWHWDGETAGALATMDRAYTSEVDKLTGVHIDLAMVPVDPRLERTALWGARYFMEKADADLLVPMHMWGDYSICNRLVSDPACAFFAHRVVNITHRGQLIEL